MLAVRNGSVAWQAGVASVLRMLCLSSMRTRLLMTYRRGGLPSFMQVEAHYEYSNAVLNM